MNTIELLASIATRTAALEQKATGGLIAAELATGLAAALTIIDTQLAALQTATS